MAMLLYPVLRQSFGSSENLHCVAWAVWARKQAMYTFEPACFIEFRCLLGGRRGWKVLKLSAHYVFQHGFPLGSANQLKPWLRVFKGVRQFNLSHLSA